jgi:hypothetical protein
MLDSQILRTLGEGTAVPHVIDQALCRDNPTRLSDAGHFVEASFRLSSRRSGVCWSRIGPTTFRYGEGTVCVGPNLTLMDSDPAIRRMKPRLLLGIDDSSDNWRRHLRDAEGFKLSLYVGQSVIFACRGDPARIRSWLAEVAS